MRAHLVLLFALTAASIAWSGQVTTEQAPSIASAQARVSDSFRESDLSPFTAIASRYFTGGDGARIVPAGDAYTFEAVSAPGAVVELHFDGREVRIDALPGGGTLLVRLKQGEGGVAAGGRPLAGPGSLADTEVLAIGRVFLETGARPGTGRAILYDPRAAARRAFTGLHWFAPNPSLRVRAVYAPVEKPDRIVVTTSRGLEKEYYRVGTFAFEAAGVRSRLVALSPSVEPKPGDELFIPFRDTTTGGETYAVGRYLTVPFEGAAAAYFLDFNLATNPYCAYSPHYNCVIPPRENTLRVAINAGEKRYH
jgi:uncharacterized protein